MKDYIEPTKEFIRIKNLPRRKFDPTDRHLLGIRDMMTAWLKTPDGTEELLPIQAFVLKEFHDYKGFIGALPVGTGKTHIFALAPTVLECERPIGIIPAKHLKEKTPRHLKKIGRHWRVRDDITLLSYEKIGVVSGKEILFDLRPDLLMLDEMQYVKNRKGVARTKRVEKYIRQYIKEHRRKLKVIGLSGTFMDRSMLQGWHIMYWIHPFSMPLPRKWWEFHRWQQAVEGDPMFTGLYPGVLNQFCNLDEDLTDGIGRRVVETPGIISIENDDVRCSLTIEALWPNVPDIIQEYVSTMRQTMETPGGEPFETALQLWAHSRELGCGFYRQYKDPPPSDWIWQRREWSKMVRDVLKYSRKYETPHEVALAAKRGDLPLQQRNIWQSWHDIRDTYKPVTVPIWVSDYLINYAAEWLANEPRGLVWCEMVPFCERLAEKSGVPYFHNLGKTKDGIFVEDFSGPAIVSPMAVKDGYNLQYSWDKNLIISCKPNNEDIEQMLGRTHRQFQLSDEVWAGFVFTVDETIKGFEKMIEEARKYKTIHNSKLLYADYINIDIDEPIRRPNQ